MVIAVTIAGVVAGLTALVKFWNDSKIKAELQSKIDGLKLVVSSLDAKVKLYEQSFVTKAKTIEGEVKAQVEAVVVSVEKVAEPVIAEVEKVL